MAVLMIAAREILASDIDSRQLQPLKGEACKCLCIHYGTHASACKPAGNEACTYVKLLAHCWVCVASLSPRAMAVSVAPKSSGLQAAMLGSKFFWSQDVTQMCILAGNTRAGNLKKLISQVQMAGQLVQAPGESFPALVETTHRVVIPAAHFKKGRHAIFRCTATLQATVQNPAASTAEGGIY